SCSVTEVGPVFEIVNLTYVNTYTGSASCSGTDHIAQRSLTICAQVSNTTSGKTVWYTIDGSCLSQKLTTARPLYLTTGRTAYLGHGHGPKPRPPPRTRPRVRRSPNRPPSTGHRLRSRRNGTTRITAAWGPVPSALTGT